MIYSFSALCFIGYSLLFTLRTFAVSIAEANSSEVENWVQADAKLSTLRNGGDNA